LWLTLLVLEMMHHRADTIDADLRILGFAIPDAPVQPFDRLDDHRFRFHLCRVIHRQAAGDLLQGLQPHGDVEPVQDRQLRDPGIGKDAPQPRTAIGERCQDCGLGSPDGVEAAVDQQYAALRLFVNFFQPSFKLAEKSRDGTKVRKRYHAPATPHQRLVADARTSEAVRSRVNAVYATLDPVGLLATIRAVQQELVEIADRPITWEAGLPSAPTLEQFLSGLRTAWQAGDVRPTSCPAEKVKPEGQRYWRRRADPFVTVTAQMREWFEAEPWRTSRELFERLRHEHPGVYPAGQLRILQRRIKGWRREVAHTLVFGVAVVDGSLNSHAATGAGP